MPGDTALDLLGRDRAGILRDVVGAGHDMDHRRLERDHVAAEADEHLRRGLAGNAAADEMRIALDEGLLGPALEVIESPMNTTRCAIGGGEQGPVGLAIAADERPVAILALANGRPGPDDLRRGGFGGVLGPELRDRGKNQRARRGWQ